MPNESVTTISDQVDMLIDSTLSLAELFGPDWKQKTIFPSTEEAFGPEEIKLLSEKRIIEESEATNESEAVIARINTIFQANGGQYIAYLVKGRHGEDRLLIEGRIGGDIIYHISDPTHYLVENGGNLALWVPSESGFITKSGAVFKFDPLFNDSNNSMYIERLGPRQSNINTTVFRRAHKDAETFTQLPRTVERIGTLFHEFGHLWKSNWVTRIELQEGRYAFHEAFDKISQGKAYGKLVDDLTSYQIRAAMVVEERSAWAIGMSVLLEVGKSIDLECGSKEFLKKIISRANSNNALGSYDQVEYSLRDHPENKPIPTFSDPRRKASRVLHTTIEETGTNYQTLPSFDDNSGENIANDPSRIQSIIDQQN